MELHTPTYFSRFRCLAGDCPHTCCAWWEVPVDRATADFYAQVPGPLGQALRAALTDDGEGGLCFRLTGGQCPFLDGGGLCALQLKWGEERIPRICREHPRFSYDYGPLREVGLCASCPECARLILAEDFALDVSPLSAPGGEADPLLAPLVEARDTAFSLLSLPQVSLGQRLRALLLFVNDLQTALDREDPAALPQLCRFYREGFPLAEGLALTHRSKALAWALELLGGLEILQPTWKALLDRAMAALEAGEVLPPPPPREGSRAAAYLLYRHFLRGLNDADVLTWAELAVLGPAVAGALAPLDPQGFPETFRRFCLEVEHSQNDLDALQDALWSPQALGALLALAAE